MSPPRQEFRAFWRQFLALHMQNNGFAVLQRYYERHFTPVGKALLLLLMISLSLGMVGTEVLIYIFLCCLAGLWFGTLVVGWLSRPRSLSASLLWPGRIQAGQTVKATLVIENPDRHPVFHLLSELRLLGPEQQLLLLRPHEEIFCVDRGQRCSQPFEWTPASRGCWQLPEVHFISMFPLGLALWRQRQQLQQQIWVYPRLLELIDPPWRQHHPQMLQMASQSSLLRGDSLEFQGIRPWLPGDSPRFIHWPSLARSGQLAVREYQETPGHQLALLLQTPGPGDPQAFETSVSLMAGLLQTLASQPYHQLMLAQIGECLSLAGQQPLTQEQLMLQLAKVRAEETFNLDALWDTLLQLPAAPTLLICLACSWDAQLAQLQQQCQLRHWPLEILAVSRSAVGFPGTVRWIEPGMWPDL
ncbi:MAG: DUF58 domain-containing protein [Candidatus Sericytochromatia bacterium]